MLIELQNYYMAFNIVISNNSLIRKLIINVCYTNMLWPVNCLISMLIHWSAMFYSFWKKASLSDILKCISSQGITAFAVFVTRKIFKILSA